MYIGTPGWEAAATYNNTETIRANKVVAGVLQTLKTDPSHLQPRPDYPAKARLVNAIEEAVGCSTEDKELAIREILSLSEEQCFWLYSRNFAA